MKITKKNKIILSCIALVLCMLSLTLAFTVKNTEAQENNVYYEGERVRASYTINESFDIPNAMIEQNKTYYNATGVLVFPSGKTAVDTLTTLDEAGEYTLQYRAEINGKVVIESIKFNVVNTLYSLSGARSSAEYGVHPYAPNKEGVKVSLAPGEEFVYNRVIDLSKVNKLDKLISFFITPEVKGQHDVARAIVKFTDVYNPDNYVNLTIKKEQSNSGGTWAETTSYVVANASNQPPTGIRVATNGEVTYNGVNYTLSSNSAFGTDFEYSMVGEPYVDYGKEEFYVGWDYAERIIYGPSKGSDQVKMVIDLDAPELFNALWEGFTTGEVVMSVSASNYVASKFNFVVTELNGEDLSDIDFTDSQKPYVNVDFGVYDIDNVPNAIVGKPYKLFPVTAFDTNDGELVVSQNVYYNYGGSNRVNVSVIDGVFVPEKQRTYTIVYTATDRAGNKTVCAIPVNVIPAEDAMLSIEVSDYEDTGSAGVKVPLAVPTVVSALTYYEVTPTVTIDGQSVEVLKDNTFIPTRAGVYTVTFNVENYIESQSISYQVTINSNDQPIFTNRAVLPKYFINGATYNLEVPKAYHYTDGSQTTADVSLTYKNDNGQENSGNPRSFTVTANNEVTLIYTANNGQKKDQQIYTVPVVDVGYGNALNLPNYFKTKNVSVVNDTAGAVFTTSTNDNSFEFINGITLSTVEFSIKLGTAAAALGNLDLYLTNQVNNGQKIKLSLINGAKGVELSINDGNRFPTGSSWLSDKSLFNFSVDLNNKVVTLNDKTYNFTTDADGEPYTTPSEYFVYFSGSMGGVTAETSATVTKIVNQSLRQNKNKDGEPVAVYDVNAPYILCTPIGGTFSEGDKITVAPIMATDVFDPNITCTVTVVGPDKQLVVSDDGVTLGNGVDISRAYDVTLNKIGTYTITYYTEDYKGNDEEYMFTVNVIDKQPPKLTVDTGSVVAVIGTEVMVKSYTVTDDGETVTVLITVTKPNQAIVSVEDKFKVTEKGTYVVTYYAYDKEGNFTLASYKVIV